MAAKLLHSLADDNADLQKQIGCMTGIFHLLDRNHILTPRRLTQKRLPSGNSHFNNRTFDTEFNDSYHQQAANINSSRNVNEKHRISTESSRHSFSSSCSSSVSSLEYNKISQEEASSFDRIIFPNNHAKDAVMNESIVSPNLGRQHLDLRDVVKDSMYREARGISVKTAIKDEAGARASKRKDSPSPLQPSMAADGSYGAVASEKKTLPADLRESLRVLEKLREAPWYYNNEESYEANGSWNLKTRDGRRFSYDGREINFLSFESRDTSKSTQKLKDLPRLSLDSRERSMRGSNELSKHFHDSSNFISKDANPPQTVGARPPSIVAKLMGLEPFPESSKAGKSQPSSTKIYQVDDTELLTRSIRANDSRQIRTANFARNSPKDPTSPRWKSHDLVMKPISNSRFPIEPAPWKQMEGSRGSYKQGSKLVKVPGKTPSSVPSVYSEIEKRLKDLEFRQSGKDLRALKQILEAMQAKGLLDTRREEQAPDIVNEREFQPKLTKRQTRKGPRSPPQKHVPGLTMSGSDPISFESPIVIMKPAKLVQKSGIPASSVIPIDSLSSIQKIQSCVNADSRKSSVDSRVVTENSPKSSHTESTTSTNDKRLSKQSTRHAQPSSKLPKEGSRTPVKNSGSVSPRLQQKNLELDKRSRPPTPPSDSNRQRRQSSRHQAESGSPGGRRRPKSTNMQDDQLSQISNESRTSSVQGDDISPQLESDTVLESKMDMEVSSKELSVEVGGSQSPSVKAAKNLVSGLMQNKPTPGFGEDVSSTELAVVAPEHPSPVSVLDTSVYKDDAPSPVKQLPHCSEGDDAQSLSYSPTEEQWDPAESCLSSCRTSGLALEANRKKLQNVEHLVQKLRRLNSNHDEANTDYIASLCENTNPDHRYISEILLASGLLLRDLGSGLSTFQLHPSGHPINPELFLVLEQTKSSSLPVREESNPEKTSYSKENQEKSHRKLIFDAVNEILVAKLALVQPSSEPWIKTCKLAKKTLNAQKLLKELCYEMEHLEFKKPERSLEDGGEEDELKNILKEDVMNRSGSWTNFFDELSGIVLDVERLLFKDLVDEIVIGEAGRLRSNRSKRQLFAK